MKNKKLSTRIISMILTVLMVLGSTFLFGCGGPDGGSKGKLQFWVYGDEQELEVYTLMTEEFNRTYGAAHGIEVEISAKPVGTQYTNLIQQTASASSGADIFFVIENEFKRWVEMGFMQDLTPYFQAIDDIDISDIPESMLIKYRYDEVNETLTDSSDPLYGLPMQVQPTALFYNETAFKKAGIIVISVDENKMDAWNAGEIADNRGVWKKDIAKLNGVNVPKKGYFRNDGAFNVYGAPASDVIQVFNNRIAMNWDEIEDLAKIFSPVTNKNAAANFGTEYGYYTEWWFNYGWSVGGDCLADLTGDGYWNFSLLDPYKNYMVNVDSYVGEFSGTTYKKGDTLSLVDKLEVPKGQRLTPDNLGGYKLNGQNATVRASVLSGTANGDFTELPSTRTAFNRYAALGVKPEVIVGDTRNDIDHTLTGGLGISPTPSIFSGSGKTSVNYFIDGKIAMLVEQAPYMKTIALSNNFEFDVAPIAVYKEYTNPSDPYCDEIKAQGKIAGHSNSKGLVTRKKSERKDEIARFIMWMASKDGQRVRAKAGYFPNQSSLTGEIVYTAGNTVRNVAAFSDALQHQKAGDWWYLKNYTWIDVWAVPLNSNFRNNLPGYTYEKWVDEGVADCNEMLLQDYIKN